VFKIVVIIKNYYFQVEIVLLCWPVDGNAQQTVSTSCEIDACVSVKKVMSAEFIVYCLW